MQNNKRISIIKSYNNCYVNRYIIYKEMNNKTGIYMWINLINGKIYIGSATDLKIRLYNYLSKTYITKYLQENNSYIYSSILKYDYINFSFNIIKYCSKDDLVKWEQYYINLLKPEYNILKIARSSLGFKHSLATIQRLKDIRRLREGNITILLNKIDYSIQKYNCTMDACKFLNISYDVIKRYIKKGKLFNNTYIIIRLLKMPSIDFILDNFKDKNVNLVTDNISSFIIEVINKNSNQITIFPSIRKASKFINKHHCYITKCLNKANLYENDKYIIIRKYLQ